MTPNDKKIQNTALRLSISIAALMMPVIFLAKNIYGSFVFTFSIPLLWQIGFLGKPIDSLGLRLESFKFSIIAGVVSGCFLGFLGGTILKSAGIIGYMYDKLDSLKFSFGSFHIAFPLQHELGYRLLSASNTTMGLCIYLLFSIFIIGLGEEVFWRGFIQQKISACLSSHKAILLTATLFALIHFYIFIILPFKAGIFFLVLIFIAGGIWGYLFKYFDNVWCPALSHGTAAFIIWKYYFFNH